MKRASTKLKTTILSAAIGILAANPSYAEDTEIYTSVGSSTTGTLVDPNVLFIIDTSGSMDSNISITLGTYDPTQTYAAAPSEPSCSEDFIYYSSLGTPPRCIVSTSFARNKNRCSAAEGPLFSTTIGIGTGFFQDRIARFSLGSFFVRRPGWIGLSSATQNPPHVDCRADEGVHGQTTGNPAVYIFDNNAAYTNQENQRKDWNGTGSFVTLYSANYLNYYFNTSNVINTTRLQVVKDTVKAVINSNSNLNVGLMRFNRDISSTSLSIGGSIVSPFLDIDAAGVKSSINTAIDNLTAQGTTPLSDTMYEAALIYRGEKPVYGSRKSPPTLANPPTETAAITTPLALVSSDPSAAEQYKTPIISFAIK